MAKTKNDLSDWVDCYTSDNSLWALHKASNAELAADLVQDTFLATAEKLEGLKSESSPKTWLFSILNFKIIDHYRKKVNQPIPHESESLSRFFEPEGDWPESRKSKNWYDDKEEHLPDNHKFQAVLKKCLGTLPEKWNLCVSLYSSVLAERKKCP